MANRFFALAPDMTMTTSSTLIAPMAYGQTESTMAALTADLSRNQPHGLAWALGCLAQHRDG